jgi:hypothetical protein
VAVASTAPAPLLLPSPVLPFAAFAADAPPALRPPPPQPEMKAATQTATSVGRKKWLHDMDAPRKK